MMSPSPRDKRVSATYMKNNHSSPSYKWEQYFCKSSQKHNKLRQRIGDAPRESSGKISSQVEKTSSRFLLKKATLWRLWVSEQNHNYITTLYSTIHRIKLEKQNFHQHCVSSSCINHLRLCSHYFTFNRRCIFSLKGTGAQTERQSEVFYKVWFSKQKFC